VAVARVHRDFSIIARSTSDEAIQQERAKASSKRRTLDCFTAITRSGGVAIAGVRLFSVIARSGDAAVVRGHRDSSSLRGA
jgi:hypothetical protein